MNDDHRHVSSQLATHIGPSLRAPTRILNCAAEGVVIALLAWILLRALGRQNSGTRFAVWFAALIGIAALPLFGTWVPARAKSQRTVRDHDTGFMGALHIRRVVLIAAAGLLRIGVGFWRLRQLRQSCVRIDDVALDPCSENFGRIRLTRDRDALRVRSACGCRPLSDSLSRWSSFPPGRCRSCPRPS